MTDREPASFIQRTGAYVIDIVALGFIWFGIIVLLAIPGGDDETEGFTEPWDTIANVIIFALPAFWFVYHWISNAIGVSIGKRVLSISIEPSITALGPVLRGLIRTVGEVISAIPLGLGYLWALWDADNRTWHDRMASTRVVRGKAAAFQLPAELEREEPAQRAPVKNLRFDCDPPSPAAGVRYVELRREGVRYEDEHGLRGLLYPDIIAASVTPSGDVELRFHGRDLFGRPSEQSVRFTVHDREPFLAELEARSANATGRRLDIVRTGA